MSNIMNTPVPAHVISEPRLNNTLMRQRLEEPIQRSTMTKLRFGRALMRRRLGEPLQALCVDTKPIATDDQTPRQWGNANPLFGSPAGECGCDFLRIASTAFCEDDEWI